MERCEVVYRFPDRERIRERTLEELCAKTFPRLKNRKLHRVQSAKPKQRKESKVKKAKKPEPVKERKEKRKNCTGARKNGTNRREKRI